MVMASVSRKGAAAAFNRRFPTVPVSLANGLKSLLSSFVMLMSLVSFSCLRHIVFATATFIIYVRHLYESQLPPFIYTTATFVKTWCGF